MYNLAVVLYNTVIDNNPWPLPCWNYFSLQECPNEKVTMTPNFFHKFYVHLKTELWEKKKKKKSTLYSSWAGWANTVLPRYTKMCKQTIMVFLERSNSFKFNSWVLKIYPRLECSIKFYKNFIFPQLHSWVYPLIKRQVEQVEETLCFPDV